LLSGIKTLKHLEIPTLMPRAYFYRTEKSPTTLIDWATNHENEPELRPVAPHPEFITIGEVLLRYHKEPATTAHYEPIQWMPQEEQSNKARTGMFFIDGEYVERPPICFPFGSTRRIVR